MAELIDFDVAGLFGHLIRRGGPFSPSVHQFQQSDGERRGRAEARPRGDVGHRRDLDALDGEIAQDLPENLMFDLRRIGHDFCF